MKPYKYLALGLILVSSLVAAQSAVVRGEASAGVYQNIATDGSQNLRVSIANVVAANAADPCSSLGNAKLSVPINITSATTTSLVGISGSTVIYVCGFTFSISQVVTTPNTLKFVTGTGATCGTSTIDATGLYGDGGVTAAAPIVVSSSVGSTIFKSPGGRGVCATTAIGTTASFQGVLTYVQQ